VLRASAGLSEQARGLTAEVEAFVSGVAAA
jgi:hypothetical protein